MTTATLVARPTVYEGIHMRSRMEARVAAYLDRLGWPWLYEPRAYASGGVQYLPDFEFRPWSKGVGRVFLEVKGAHPAPHQMADLFDRMLVIRASDPEAWLAVVSDGMLRIGRFGLNSPSHRRRTFFEAHAIRCPDHPARVSLRPDIGDGSGGALVMPWCLDCDPYFELRVPCLQAADYWVREP